MRARLSVMFVGALVMVVTSLLSPAAFAQEQNQQRDPNEGEPKHEINELQNRLHQTEDKSKENHLEGRIDALQDQRVASQPIGGIDAGASSSIYRNCNTTSGSCYNCIQPYGTCYTDEEFKKKRDGCIALAVFTFGFLLLGNNECNQGFL